jgi:hypothetical protein
MNTDTDAVTTTPSAQWRVNGEQDPHGKQYDCERAALTLGKFTDDELANGVFMNADRPMDIARVLANDPDYHAPIVWLTAAKERIRWLSRALENAIAANSASTAPAQSCGQAEFGTARERFISGAPVQASEHVLELARQALAARDSDTRTDDEKIAAAVDFICDTRLDQPVKCGDAEQADERNDGEEAMQAAAATLPAAYDLRIYLERGAGWVELYDPDGKSVEFDEDTDSGMAGRIRAATAEAIEHARAKDSK